MTTQLLPVREAILGKGFPIKRAMPTKALRNIGAWVFLDHAGPSHFAAGDGMDVGPHPHIGLQTFTWLLDGEVMHHDSLGNEQIIRPYQINLMTAGNGISHTELSTATSTALHAAQLWIALPKEKHQQAPDFVHYPLIPHVSHGQYDIHVLVGQYQEHQSAVAVQSPLMALDIQGRENTQVSIALDRDFEHGVLLLEGHASVNDQALSTENWAYLPTGQETLDLHLQAGSRLLLIGGTPLTEKPIVWWNFVGWSHEDIAQARADWQNHHPRFGQVTGYTGQASRFQAPEITATLKSPV